MPNTQHQLLNIELLENASEILQIPNNIPIGSTLKPIDKQIQTHTARPDYNRSSDFQFDEPVTI